MTTLTEPSAARGENELTQRWSRWTYWPLAIAAAVFLITYTLHVIGDVEGGVLVATTITIWLIWAMFITDYFVRLRLSHPRRLWFRTHKLDLVLAFVPALRPIRLLDAFTRIASFTRTTGNSDPGTPAHLRRGRCPAARLVHLADRPAGRASRTRRDDHDVRSAVWWAFCTVTTVGYGDYVPITPLGRVAAVFLMAGGVVVVGLVVATISSWVVERASRGHDDAQPASRADMRALTDALQQASERIAAERRSPGS